MPNRFQDWFKQAEHDLQVAQLSRRKGFHDWACFAAQQAAEKALKALYLQKYQKAYCHMITSLLQDLPDAIVVSDDLYDKAMVLDSYYYPTRYPCCFPEGAPCDHYGVPQSRDAIEYSTEIIRLARSQMAQSR